VEISTLSQTSCKWNPSVPIHEFCLSVHARHIGYGCLLHDLNTNNDIVASTVVTNTKKKIHIRMQHQLDLVATITRFLSWHHPTTITSISCWRQTFQKQKSLQNWTWKNSPSLIISTTNQNKKMVSGLRAEFKQLEEDITNPWWTDG